MPIAIQCATCHRPYNVDDKLAGKSVKCKGCGAAITVAAPVTALIPDLPPEPDILGLEESAAGDGAPAHGPLGPAVQKCPSCGAPLATASRICLACGLNLVTGKRSAVAEIPLAGESEELKRRRKRYVRKPGNQILEQVDELAKLVMALILFGGVIVWFVQIVRSPMGLSTASLAPGALIVALMAGVMAPITSFGISIVESKLNFVPRHDTYVRVVLTLLLPLSVSLLFCWPNLEDRFGGFATLAWLMSPVLLIYMLRGEPVDWVASVITAGVGIGLGTLLMSFIASGVSQMAGPLYVDAMPRGPWTSLATGHSPQPAATAPAVAGVDVKPWSPPSASVPPADNPTPIASAAPAARTEVHPALLVPPANTTASVSPADIAMNDTRQATPAAPAITTTTPPASIPTLPRKISSLFFSSVIADEAGLQGASDVVAPSASSNYMLVLRNGETTTTVERWSVSPLKKDGEMSSSFFAAKPSSYMVSPRGDVLVTLVQFPRTQLELSYFDGKTPRKIQSMDQLHTVPSLIGFLDSIRFAIRADMTNPTRTMIQYCNSLSGLPARELSAQPVFADINAVALSPSGHYLAALGTDNQVAIYNIDAGMGVRKIPISNNLQFKLVHMCFSPDSTQIAVYAVVADIPTVQSFKVTTGEPTNSSVIAHKPRPSALRRAAVAQANTPPDDTESPTLNHDLLWLQDGKYWLVNGTDFIDAVSGKKVGVLDLDNVEDQQLVGTDSILFAQGCAGNSRNLVIAKINDTQLKAAADRAH